MKIVYKLNQAGSKVPGVDLTANEKAYLKHWMLPNLFFHVTMAYAILRHNGVELGKKDYLMGAAG